MAEKVNKNIYIRHWLAEVRTLIGDGYLQKTFGSRSMASWKRTAIRWTNPKEFEAEQRRNPIETLKILLEDLKTLPGGRKLVIQYAVLIADIAGGTFSPRHKFNPVKSIAEECLEDYEELGIFHNLRKSGASIEEVEFQAMEVKREIDETVEAFKQSFE